MWCEIFIVGGVLFYCLMTIATIFLLLCIEWERPILSGITLILTFLLLALFGNFNLFTEIHAHPLISLGVFVGYFAVGVFWSIAKWWFFIQNKIAQYKNFKKEFLEQKNLPVSLRASEIPKKHKREWQSKSAYPHHQFYKPKVNENKRRILTWMIYWPWSFVWTIINDPITKLFKQIFNQLRFIYEGIANRAYQSIEDDFNFTESEDRDLEYLNEDDSMISDDSKFKNYINREPKNKDGVADSEEDNDDDS